MSELLITKDDVGKVFIRRDGKEAAIIKYNAAERAPYVVLAICHERDNEYLYYTNGLMYAGAEEPCDLIKRKEETMRHDAHEHEKNVAFASLMESSGLFKKELKWIKCNGTDPKLPARAIIEVRCVDGASRVSSNVYFAGKVFNWGAVTEYRIVEAAPEEKCNCDLPVTAWGGLSGKCVRCRKPTIGEEKPEPKRVELKDLWRVWYKLDKAEGNLRQMQVHTQLIEGSYSNARNWIGYNGMQVLAITYGDAQGYTPGEGL